ncbi:MAG: hypothetical protein AAB427_06205 [Chloroflexota bacterium]
METEIFWFLLPVGPCLLYVIRRLVLSAMWRTFPATVSRISPPSFAWPGDAKFLAYFALRWFGPLAAAALAYIAAALVGAWMNDLPVTRDYLREELIHAGFFSCGVIMAIIFLTPDR